MELFAYARIQGVYLLLQIEMQLAILLICKNGLVSFFFSVNLTINKIL